MTKFIVVGAGLAGLTAAAILRESCESVFEAQSQLPNNHSALLRFRSSVVGDTLNIPFEPVDVIKTVVNPVNPVADAVAYSLKTNGTATLRSVVSAQGLVERRYIAPFDFASRLLAKVTSPIAFDAGWHAGSAARDYPVISTIPMSSLMHLLKYEGVFPEFHHVVGYSIVGQLRDCDLCATLYTPHDPLMYRASITKDRLIIEIAFPGLDEKQAAERMECIDTHPMEMRHVTDRALAWFGMNSHMLVKKPEVNRQKYAKILPVDDDARKRFIMWASEKHNVYSFGRFATWRPGLLMDDLINDIRVIQRLAAGGNNYRHKVPKVVESGVRRLTPADLTE